VSDDAPETYRRVAGPAAALGAVVRVHPRREGFGLAPFVLCLIAAGLLWLATLRRETFFFAACILTALAGVAAIRMAIEIVRRRRLTKITAYEHGLRLHRWTGGDDLVPWHRITSLRFERRKRPHSYRRGLFTVTYTSELHWICTVFEGPTPLFEASDIFEDHGALFDALRAGVRERELPRALESLGNGVPVSFGDVTFLPTHLQLPTGVISWDEITGAEWKDDRLFFRGRDDKPRASVAVADVRNPHVLVAAITALRSTRAQS
jgi:hypothetical protein